MTGCVCCQDERPCDCTSIPTYQCDSQMYQSTFNVYLRLSSRKNLSAAATTPAWTSTLNVDKAATMGPLHKSTCSSCLVLTELQQHGPGDSRLIIAVGGNSERDVQCTYTVFCIRQQCMGEVTACGLPVANVACRLSYIAGAGASPLWQPQWESQRQRWQKGADRKVQAERRSQDPSDQQPIATNWVCMR